MTGGGDYPRIGPAPPPSGQPHKKSGTIKASSQPLSLVTGHLWIGCRIEDGNDIVIHRAAGSGCRGLHAIDELVLSSDGYLGHACMLAFANALVSGWRHRALGRGLDALHGLADTLVQLGPALLRLDQDPVEQAVLVDRVALSEGRARA